jgi:hypothetical protein
VGFSFSGRAYLDLVTLVCMVRRSSVEIVVYPLEISSC